MEGENETAGAVLGRDAILALRAQPRAVERVEAFGSHVLVQALTAKEKDAFDASLIVGSGKHQRVATANIRARLAARSIVDEAGKLIFTDADADTLGDLPGADLQRIYDAAQRLSGISDADVEELAGN
ncbi:MAG: hypothetical protein ACR2KM_04210 [Gemmatimonadaceae bacterium]